MVNVTIRGKQFPLCLTVAALDKINEKCGGISHIGEFLNGYPGNGETADLHAGSRATVNCGWMLGLLIQEGEENRLVEARFAGEHTERRAVPCGEDLAHLLTPGMEKHYRVAVWQAVNESLKQTVEAENPKNVQEAEQG